MQHILQDTQVRVTALKFANLSSDLLAYGGQDGVVRIAQLKQSCNICHVSHYSISPTAAKLLQPCVAFIN